MGRERGSGERKGEMDAGGKEGKEVGRECACLGAGCAMCMRESVCVCVRGKDWLCARACVCLYLRVCVRSLERDEQGR